jgi:hypothetical protein
MSEPTYTASVILRDEFGELLRSGTVTGTIDFIHATNRRVLDEMEPGQSLSLDYLMELSPDHPLFGVDLVTADRTPQPGDPSSPSASVRSGQPSHRSSP